MRNDVGIRPCAYNPDFTGLDVLADDLAPYLAAVEEWVHFASDCGVPTMRLDTGAPPPGTVPRDERVRRIARAWRQATAVAADFGVKLAWEFEPGFMANSPSEVEAVVAAVPEDTFGVLFDSCHAHMVACTGARQEEPEHIPGGELELAARLAGRVNLVHLIDSDGTIHDGFTSTHAPFGTGEVDFPPLIAALRAGGYEGPWWTVDVCFWPEADAITQPSFDYVHGLLSMVPSA
jgi:sugar phosphate isomerase/epimerase